MAKRKIKTNNDQQTLHRKLKIEQHEPHQQPRVNSCAPEGYEVPVPLVGSVVLF
jgi:hypothetical protein